MTLVFSPSEWAPALPSPSTLLAILPLLLFLTHALLSTIYNLHFHPLRSYPGPLLWRGTPLGKISAQLRGDLTNAIHALHIQYGPVVRIAPTELSYISAQAWRDIYGTSAPKSGGGESTMPNIIYGQSELEMFGARAIFWQVEGKEHARHRRVIAEGFGGGKLKGYESIVGGYVDMLVGKLKERCCGQGGKQHEQAVVDLGAWLSFFSFDVIGDLVFGESFGCLERGAMHPWMRFIFGNLRAMMYDQIISAMGQFGVLLRRWVPEALKAQALAHVENTREWVRRAVMEERGLVTHFGEALSFDEVTANANLLVVAGSETVATQLPVVGYYVMSDLEVWTRVRDEVRGAFEKEEEINVAAVSAKLPYLLAVLNEALRIHTPVPVGIHKLVPEGGTIIDGQWVPGGTDVTLHQWSAFRSPVHWRDAESFRPERWLGDERYAGDNRDVFQPFHFGPRNCIGRGLAHMEARLVWAKLIWNFDMELEPESANWAAQKTWILYEKGPLLARLTPVVPRR
ncbi:hypothetical protein OQA88_11620 [Cercophora sp. LCS_1]